MEKVKLDVTESTCTYTVRAYDRFLARWLIYRNLNLSQVPDQLSILAAGNRDGIRFINIHYVPENKIYGTPD